MNQVTLKLETLTCPSCVNKIEKAVTKTKGVEQVNVLFNASKIKVSYDENMTNADEISRVVERVGFEVIGRD